MMMAEPVPCLSVVVPTYKRPELLERCLAALMTQHLDSTAYEIIVVDDGNDLQTRCLVDSWAKWGRPILRYISAAKTNGPAAARNSGWRAAQGDIIAFTDDDCLPEPGWLLAGANAFSEGVSALGSGQVSLRLPTQIPAQQQRGLAQEPIVVRDSPMVG
jgi:glycosyltransferase involved in cell wall biosynthesis